MQVCDSQTGNTGSAFHATTGMRRIIARLARIARTVTRLMRALTCWNPCQERGVLLCGCARHAVSVAPGGSWGYMPPIGAAHHDRCQLTPQRATLPIASLPMPPMPEQCSGFRAWSQLPGMILNAAWSGDTGRPVAGIGTGAHWPAGSLGATALGPGSLAPGDWPQVIGPGSLAPGDCVCLPARHRARTCGRVHAGVPGWPGVCA